MAYRKHIWHVYATPYENSIIPSAHAATGLRRTDAAWRSGTGAAYADKGHLTFWKTAQ
jgi:hypothetical protein